MLSQREQERYLRHTMLAGFGLDRQLKLKQSRVLAIGAGGLGSPALQYLAAAGVGTIGIIDDDQVDRSNLQRQVIHTELTVGKAKTESAADALLAINPDIEVRQFPQRLTAANAAGLFAQFDLVLDGADNFPTRYLVNDAAFFAGIPCVHGAIFAFEGQVSVFDPKQGAPCYRCLFPTPPEPGAVPSCAEAGVLGVLPGIIGTMMATEAIKILADLGEPLRGKLLRYDALSMQTMQLTLSPQPDCALCGEHPSITELKAIPWDDGNACELPDAKNDNDASIPQRITPETYQTWREQGRQHILIDVREDAEVALGAFPPAEHHFHIPLGQLPQQLEPAPWAPLGDRPIICLCQGGVRSLRAAKLLRSRGYRQVSDILGGWNACRTA